MHSKSTELTVTVKIQNLNSRKEEKKRISLPSGKRIDVGELIIAKLTAKKAWDTTTDSINTLYIRNKNKTEKYEICSTNIVVQKGDKFFLKRNRIGELAKKKKVRRYTTSSTSDGSSYAYHDNFAMTSMMMDTSAHSHAHCHTDVSSHCHSDF